MFCCCFGGEGEEDQGGSVQEERLGVNRKEEGNLGLHVGEGGLEEARAEEKQDGIRMTEFPKFAVLAGAAQVFWLPEATVKLNAKLAGEHGAVKHVRWSLGFSPEGSSVKFTDDSKLQGEATLDKPGAYMLTCEVEDQNGNKANGSMVVEVYSESCNFRGYPLNFLRDLFAGDTLGTEYDFDELLFDVCKPCPPPYQHPRIYMNPEDAPRMRDVMKNTGMGKWVYEKVASKVGRAKPKSEEEKENERNMNPDDDVNVKGNAVHIAYLAYQILLAFIDENEEEGRAAAEAVALYAEKRLPAVMASRKEAYSYVCSDKMRKKNPQQHFIDYRTSVQGPVERKTIALAYDFGYHFMTEEQRDHCRRIIMWGIKDITCIGMDAPPSLDVCRSNWVTHYGQILCLYFAVEGESTQDGSICADMNTFVRSEASVERFLTFGINPDGSAYEGMGKNQLEIEIIIALAKRGFWSLASLSVRNHILRFYSAHLLPSGTNDIDRKHPDWCFTWDEAIGGTYQPSRYADVAAFKHSYPTNPVADVLYRAELQDCTSRLWDFNLRFPFKAMEFFSRIICMEVPNRSKPFLNMYAENMKNLPLTYFTDYQGRMVTQSSWQCHATQLHFQPRHVRGGHAHCDRNKIAFYSLKKCWIEDTGSNSASSFLHSVVVIDNNEGKPGLLPAKTIAFADTDIATFAAGDARAAYATTGPKCSQYVPFTHNDFRFTKLDRPFYDVPTVHLPNWETGNRRGPREQDGTHSIIGFPVRAFRTVGLIRGNDHPYAVVVDDIQQFEDKPAKYSFQLAIERDISHPKNRDEHVKFEGREVIIKDIQSEKKCLIRFVDCAEEPTYEWRPNTGTLCCNVTALTPKFKVIIYAFRPDMPVPETSFQDNVLRVKIGNGPEDTFHFNENQYGRNDFVFQRNGREILDFSQHKSTNGEVLFIPKLQDITQTPEDPRDVVRESRY